MGTLRASEIFNNSGIIIIALELVDCRHSKSDAVCQLYGSIELIAVIICDEDGVHAFDTDIKPVALDRLRQGVSEFDTLIAPFIKAMPENYIF